MGRVKALLEFQGETLLDRQIRLYAACCQPVVCVLGFQCEAIAHGLRQAQRAVLVLNPSASEGQLSSLQCGLRALPPCEAVFFSPADSPGVSAGTVASVMEAWRGASRKPAFVIPRHQGRRGHPVLMNADLIPAMLQLPAGESARDLVHRHAAETLYADVEDPLIHADLDTPGDYEALLKAVRP